MRRQTRRQGWRSFGFLLMGLCVTWGMLAVLIRPEATGAEKQRYRSPFDLAYSPDGETLAVSDDTGGALVLIDAKTGRVDGEVQLRGRPAGVAWAPDGERVFVAERGAGSVAEVDAATKEVVRRLTVGPRPVGVALAPERGVLLAANSGTHSVSIVDLRSGKEKRRISGVHSPFFLTVTPDEKLALVGSLLPATPADDPTTSASVSLLDLDADRVVAEIRVPPNGSNLRQIAVSPDGKWAYAVHNFGRATLPTTQLDRGWVNTNALTIIDLAKRERLATVLLDQVMEGAANPWGVAISGDGETLWISLAGVHQMAKIDAASLHQLIGGEIPAEELEKRGYPSIWREITEDPDKRELLANDLAALWGAGVLERIRIDANGPRGIDLSPDGTRLAVAGYYSSNVLVLDTGTGAVASAISVGESPEPDLARRGEMMFHDATLCFQHWLACVTCHPEGRADGLNWDLMNDGIGNPKNARSLLLSHKTPPMMSLGVRESMEEAAAAGFRHILFREPEEGELEAVTEYLRAMEPEKSPYLSPNGNLSAKAKRGNAIFESEKTQCAECHPAPLYTDLKTWNVGTRGRLDRADAFDTQTLIEIWRTGPYLHDGGAADLTDMLTTHNPENKHGKTAHLTKAEISALVEYLLSL
jgi:YVTN family beta-propeller protein